MALINGLHFNIKGGNTSYVSGEIHPPLMAPYLTYQEITYGKLPVIRSLEWDVYMALWRSDSLKQLYLLSCWLWKPFHLLYVHDPTNSTVLFKAVLTVFSCFT